MSFSKEVKEELLSKTKLNKIDETDESLERALVLNAFLNSGSINNPNNVYHLEIIFKQKENAENIQKYLEKRGITSHIIARKNKYNLYIKDGEDISDFLAFVGASASVIKFEEIRVVRDLRNNVNRIVNCETANLNKTVNASLESIADIKLLKKKKKFESLDDNLKELAELRIENPEATLKELGEMLNNPISKSGVSHRLRKISEIAKF